SDPRFFRSLLAVNNRFDTGRDKVADNPHSDCRETSGHPPTDQTRERTPQQVPEGHEKWTHSNLHQRPVHPTITLLRDKNVRTIQKAKTGPPLEIRQRG